MLNAVRRNPSLRLRLFARIVIPLMFIALLLGAWRVSFAVQMASALFDRNLTAVAIAIASDVAKSEGELLTPETLSLLSEVSGGKVFYHVEGPGQAYVSGYGNPPDVLVPLETTNPVPVLFDADYSDDPVRVARLSQYVSSSGLDGLAAISVWQHQAVRNRFAARQGMVSVMVIALMLGAVMMLIWFGVNSGLSPLIGLSNFIRNRNPDDLRPFAGPVPEEVVPIVENLNTLFGEVQNTIQARDRLIANATHQLRNPLSATLAQAEAAFVATTLPETKRRVGKTVSAAKHASYLAEQLLMLERLSQSHFHIHAQRCDLKEIALSASSNLADKVLDRGLEFCFEPLQDPLIVEADATLIFELIENLVDNALMHGGCNMSQIMIGLRRAGDQACVTIEDDGRGISPGKRKLVFERFFQADHGKGSGLGLAIVEEIARCHGGGVGIETPENGKGVRFVVSIPLASRS